ncbi:uncharacterized protein JCM6883_002885 [Sporobolomyces salmoneus]|uniref:uncharacterized protein n=1 Tax=Sporobolomyces salmoneus TaxID=183962 RepID=UPI00316D29F4
MYLTDTSWLPAWQFSFLSLLAVSSIATCLMSIATLAYQLHFTVGYIKSVPALLVCPALTVAHASFFLSPVTPTSTRRRKMLVSLQVELLSLVLLGLFTLATVARLHSSTPGLYSSCGGYFMCVSLQADVALAWFSLLFLVLLFFPLFVATLYHYRQSKSNTIFRESFVLFNWRVYNSGERGNRGLGEGGMRVGEQKGQDEEQSDSRFVLA